MQITVILHDVASQLFLLRSAPMRIESLVLLDVVTREDDGVPSARVLGAPLLKAEAVHAEGNGRWIHVSYVPGNLKCEVIE